MSYFLNFANGVAINACEYFSNRKNAILVQPDDLNAARKAVQKIFEDRTWAKRIGEQAKRDSQNYTWECRAKKIVEFLNSRLREMHK